MKLDEPTISEFLHEATRDLTVSDLLTSRVREGGARRLQRQRLGATVGVAALVAAVVPAAFALAPNGRGRNAINVSRGPSPTPSASSFPPARSCAGATNDGRDGAAPASAYPSLLMLPNGRSVTYAFTNYAGAPRCGYFPHVALTLLHQRRGVVSRGVEIDGPNAPSSFQAGFSGPGVGFSGNTLRPVIDGHPAVGYYSVKRAPTDVFWSGNDGDQWHATTRGLDPEQINTLLNHVRYDGQAGTATLPGAAASGWTVAPAAPDAAGDTSGVFYALWHQGNSRIALWVAPTPDRTYQVAAAGGGARLTSVLGRPAVVYRRYEDLVWQVGDDVEAHLSMTHSSRAQIQRVADSIVPISPQDPRLYRP